MICYSLNSLLSTSNLKPQRTTSNQPPLLTSQVVPRHDSMRSPSPTPLQPNSVTATKQTPPPALLPQTAMRTLTSKHATDNQVSSKEEPLESRLEQLTREWIEAHCQLQHGSSANRGEMYACYVEAVRREHNMMAGSLQMFMNKLRWVACQCNLEIHTLYLSCSQARIPLYGSY